MKNTIFNKTIPTYVGLLFLVITIITTTWVAQNSTFLNSKAALSTTPSTVQVSNITDTSFTVSYITTEPTTGSLSYGLTQDVGEIVLDERDKLAGKASNHQVHYFTIMNLRPATQYYFTILSGRSVYKDQGHPYSLTTAQTIPPVTNLPTKVMGTVLLPNGDHPSEGIAYVKTNQSQLFSTLIQTNGNYQINITTLRDKNLVNYLGLENSETLELSFQADGREAKATTYVKDAEQVPTVTLSQQYTFTVDLPVSPTQSATDSAEPTNALLLPKFSNENALVKKPQIIVPKKDQAFDDDQPQFSGTALPNKTIEIIIESETEIRASTKTDRYGNWSFRPSKPLEPGEHTISISTRDESGLLQTIVQSFVVHAEGSQFTDPSVAPTKPAATATPTIRPTIQPTIRPTTAPTITQQLPTITPSPTVVVITQAVISPTPTVYIPITRNLTPVPPPGSNEIMVMVGIATFATLVGAMLFLFIHI